MSIDYNIDALICWLREVWVRGGCGGGGNGDGGCGGCGGRWGAWGWGGALLEYLFF